MDLGRTWITMLVFILVAAAIWAGFSVYFSLNDVNVNPNAQSYTQYLPAKFDADTLNAISDRVENLPVSADSFLQLSTSNN